MQTKLQSCKNEIRKLQAAATTAEAVAVQHVEDFQSLQSRLMQEEVKATSLKQQLDAAQVSSV